jgi:hypothetical protein
MIRAVENLHDLGFVHADIKPEIFRIKNNLIYNRSGACKRIY